MTKFDKNHSENIEEKMEEVTLRPDTLDTFLGQKEIKERIAITLFASKSRGEPLPHQLLAGPPGLGKTTLAQILAKEMGASIRITSGPSLEKTGDLASTLISLEEGGILFIDEIHRLNPTIEEFLYPAMEDRKLDILIDGDSTSRGRRTIRVNLKPFTLIGATTKPGSLTTPLRSRFQTIHKMECYNLEELTDIILQSAKKLHLKVEVEAAKEIAKRARGTPRTANNHLLWVRDFALAIKKTKEVNKNTAEEALEKIQVNAQGLDSTDKKILEVLVNLFKGGPVGISSLAVACGEDPNSIEEIHEPYLISEGYIKRSTTGRIALEKAIKLIKKEHKSNKKEDTLF